MPEAQVITVTGPRDAATLGVIDAHDHLLIDSPGMPGAGFTDVERSIEEARDGLASGITHPRGDDADRPRAGPRRAARDQRGHGARHRRRERLPPRRPLPRRSRGSTRRPWSSCATGSSRTSRSACTRATGSTRRCRSTRPGPARSRAVRPTTTSAAPSGAGSRRSARRSAATGAAILVHTEIGTAAHEIVDLLVVGRRDDGPDRPRPPRSQPGLGAPRRGRGARRHARVRHRRPDEVPPGQRRPRPDRAGRRRRPPRPARAGAGPRGAELPARLRAAGRGCAT